MNDSLFFSSVVFVAKWKWWWQKKSSEKLLSNENGNSLNYNKYSGGIRIKCITDSDSFFPCHSERKLMWIKFWCRSRDGVIVGALPKSKVTQKHIYHFISFMFRTVIHTIFLFCYHFVFYFNGLCFCALFFRPFTWIENRSYNSLSRQSNGMLLVFNEKDIDVVMFGITLILIQG